MSALLRLLKAIRQEQGNKSRLAFAKEIGVSDTALYHIEIGRNEPGAELLGKLLQSRPALEALILAYLRERDGKKM